MISCKYLRILGMTTCLFLSVIFQSNVCSQDIFNDEMAIVEYCHFEEYIHGYATINEDSIIFYQIRLTIFDKSGCSEMDTFKVYACHEKDSATKYWNLVRKLINATIIYGDDTNVITSRPGINIVQKVDGIMYRTKWAHYTDAIYSPEHIMLSNYIWRIEKAHHRKGVYYLKE